MIKDSKKKQPVNITILKELKDFYKGSLLKKAVFVDVYSVSNTLLIYGPTIYRSFAQWQH